MRMASVLLTFDIFVVYTMLEILVNVGRIFSIHSNQWSVNENSHSQGRTQSSKELCFTWIIININVFHSSIVYATIKKSSA